MSTETLDIIESRILAIERQVYGDKTSPTENFNPVADSLLQTNTLMTAAVSGREKFSSVLKRLNELNEYLEINPLGDDPSGIETKLNLIIQMEKDNGKHMRELDSLEKLKQVLDEEKIVSTKELKKELTTMLDGHLEKKERLMKVNEEVKDTLDKFNNVCLEISNGFLQLNEELSKLEGRQTSKKKDSD